MSKEKYYCWNTLRWLEDLEDHRECLKKKHTSTVFVFDYNKAGFSRVQFIYYRQGELFSTTEMGDEKR